MIYDFAELISASFCVHAPNTSAFFEVMLHGWRAVNNTDFDWTEIWTFRLSASGMNALSLDQLAGFVNTQQIETGNINGSNV